MKKSFLKTFNFCLVVLLCLSMSFFIFGCGEKQNENTDDGTAGTNQTTVFTLTEEEWKSSLEFSNLNFSVSTKINQSGTIMEVETTAYGNVVKQSSSGSTSYFQKDGEKYFRYDEISNVWTKSEIDKAGFSSVREEWGNPFVENYSKFVCDGQTKTFTCSSLSYTSIVSGTNINMILTDISIKFDSDKKIIQIDFTEQPDMEGVASFTESLYFNYMVEPIILPNVS